MASTRADMRAGDELVRSALRPYNQMPGTLAIAALVDDLLRHGELLLVDVSGVEAAAAALADWHTMTGSGPTDSPLGNWNHARGLARTVRTMYRVLSEQ
ncbi:DUF6415 family natural product biosynthesis protein [Streptomyces virginiae]